MIIEQVTFHPTDEPSVIFVVARNDHGNGDWGLYAPGTTLDEIVARKVFPLRSGTAEWVSHPHRPARGRWSRPKLGDLWRAYGPWRKRSINEAALIARIGKG